MAAAKGLGSQLDSYGVPRNRDEVGASPDEFGDLVCASSQVAEELWANDSDCIWDVLSGR